MNTYICGQCQKTYSYCRACLISPILYKELGFCSEQCRNEFKNKQKEVVPAEDVEVVVMEEDTSTPTEEAIEYPYFFTATEEEVIEEKEENKEDDYEQDNREDIRTE